jgi:hypothetical protein
MSAVITNKDYKPPILAPRIGMKTLKVLVEKVKTTQHMVISSFNIQPAFTLKKTRTSTDLGVLQGRGKERRKRSPPPSALDNQNSRLER